MKVFSITETLANSSRLLRRVTAGEEVLIKRAGTPVARLVPVEPRTLRALGLDAGGFTVPDDFNDSVMEDGSDLFGPRGAFSKLHLAGQAVPNGAPATCSDAGALTRIAGTSTMTP